MAADESDLAALPNAEQCISPGPRAPLILAPPHRGERSRTGVRGCQTSPGTRTRDLLLGHVRIMDFTNGAPGVGANPLAGTPPIPRFRRDGRRLVSGNGGRPAGRHARADSVVAGTAAPVGGCTREGRRRVAFRPGGGQGFPPRRCILAPFFFAHSSASGCATSSEPTVSVATASPDRGRGGEGARGRGGEGARGRGGEE